MVSTDELRGRVPVRERLAQRDSSALLTCAHMVMICCIVLCNV